MVKQGRSESGKFTSKSGELRQVRAVRLTDSAWEKLGQFAEAQNITRADLIEEWVKDNFSQQPNQLVLFDVDRQISIPDKNPEKEIITCDTRKTGTELAHRLKVSSAALTNWLKSRNFDERSKERDPDGIAWEREPGLSKKYRPII